MPSDDNDDGDDNDDNIHNIVELNGNAYDFNLTQPSVSAQLEDTK